MSNETQSIDPGTGGRWPGRGRDFRRLPPPPLNLVCRGDAGCLGCGAANVKPLMLRRDVVAATEAGQFHIHAVDNVGQAAALLTGVPAGQADVSGQCPEGSLAGA